MAENAERNRSSSDLILGPNEFALIRDDTKGEISCYVGPMKSSLAGTDQPVTFDERAKRFTEIKNLDAAIQITKTAPEGYYVQLKNPAIAAAKNPHPGAGSKQTTPELQLGKKVNIPGPVSFALWPGQMGKVVQGHQLRSNEYLVCRVYDANAAKENFDHAIVEVAKDGDGEGKKPNSRSSITAGSLTMGKLFIIKGTEVSFYIPPTGIEVVPEVSRDADTTSPRYVRQAVTLERIEYCLLLDQNGNKRYERGPAVIFPEPTETFVERPTKGDPEKAKAKKFRAVELSETSGIYLKVIAEYEETNSENYSDGEFVYAKGEKRRFAVGEELFITGKEQMIYFPRDEHAIIKYGEHEVHYGIAIPKGEARYVLNRSDGTIRLQKGPQIFLPDPRKEVIINRALSDDQCALMFPNNAEALAHNRRLLGDTTPADIYAGGGAEHLHIRSETGGPSYAAVSAIASPEMDKRAMIRGASKSVAASEFDRKNKFTAPRQIVLNTRFDGVVMISVFNGYAVKLVNKEGVSRVIKGPQTAMLEYDEDPQVLSMSRGKPKGSGGAPLRTVYLSITNNRIGDIVIVETADAVKVKVTLSYRLNFVGENPSKWFDVDNYVKFLCDNMRSRIRNSVRKVPVREFNANSESLLRDIVLGPPGTNGEKRQGTKYEENNLHVYDVEVLDVGIEDRDVSTLISTTQREQIRQSIELDGSRRNLDFTRNTEEVKRQVMQEQLSTQQKKEEIDQAIYQAKAATGIIDAECQKQRLANTRDIELIKAQTTSKVQEINLAQAKAELDQKLEYDASVIKLDIERIIAETDSLVKRGEAVSPEFIAALTAVADAQVAEKIAIAMGPMTFLGINSETGGAMGAIVKMLEGTALGKRLQALTTEPKNGGKALTASPHSRD